MSLPCSWRSRATALLPAGSQLRCAAVAPLLSSRSAKKQQAESEGGSKQSQKEAASRIKSWLKNNSKQSPTSRGVRKPLFSWDTASPASEPVAQSSPAQLPLLEARQNVARVVHGVSERGCWCATPTVPNARPPPIHTLTRWSRVSSHTQLLSMSATRRMASCMSVASAAKWCRTRRKCSVWAKRSR